VTNLSPGGANPRGDKTEGRERASAADKEWTRLSKGSRALRVTARRRRKRGRRSLLLFLWRIFAISNGRQRSARENLSRGNTMDNPRWQMARLRNAEHRVQCHSS